MLRRLFTFLAVVSLVLFVATCVLWVRSQWVTDVVQSVQVEQPQWQNLVLESSNGQMSFGYYTGDIRRGEQAQFQSLADLGWSHFAASPPHPEWDSKTKMGRLGFVWLYQIPISPNLMLQMAVGVPHWALAAAFAVLPAIRWRRLLRRRKPPAGHCPQCGYDLRATPTRCPECGAIPATDSSQS